MKEGRYIVQQCSYHEIKYLIETKHYLYGVEVNKRLAINAWKAFIK